MRFVSCVESFAQYRPCRQRLETSAQTARTHECFLRPIDDKFWKMPRATGVEIEKCSILNHAQCYARAYAKVSERTLWAIVRQVLAPGRGFGVVSNPHL